MQLSRIYNTNELNLGFTEKATFLNLRREPKLLASMTCVSHTVSKIPTPNDRYEAVPILW